MRKAWTKEEDDYIIANFGHMTYPQLAEKLGRSKDAIKQHCYTIQLWKRAPYKGGWTDEEKEIVRKNFPTMTYKQLAEVLGGKYPATTIKCRCYSMGLKKPNIRYYTEEENDFIVMHWNTKSLEELSEFLKRPATGINMQAYKLGLRKPKQRVACVILYTEHEKGDPDSLFHDLDFMREKMGITCKRLDEKYSKS